MMSEADVSKEIQAFLSDRGLFWWRSQVFKGRVKGGYLQTGIKGLSDITVMLPACHLYIEIKKPDGKQKDGQKEFERKCKKLGHYYTVARSAHDVEVQLRRMGIIDN